VRYERLFNVLFGLSILCWAILGLYHSFSNSEFGIVRIIISVLNFTVGILVLSRRPIIALANERDTLLCIPSFICAGLLFKLTKPILEWNLFAETLFSIGGIITILSFLELGKSFAVLPDKREIKKDKFYSIIRHPAYFGESIMLLSCVLSASTNWSWIVFILFIPFLILRIITEENFLLKFKEYEIYSNHVKWKLIPFLW